MERSKVQEKITHIKNTIAAVSVCNNFYVSVDELMEFYPTYNLVIMKGHLLLLDIENGKCFTLSRNVDENGIMSARDMSTAGIISVEEFMDSQIALKRANILKNVDDIIKEIFPYCLADPQLLEDLSSAIVRVKGLYYSSAQPVKR